MRKKGIILMTIACLLIGACCITGCSDPEDALEYADAAQEKAQEIKEKAEALKDEAEKIREKADAMKQDSGQSKSKIELTDLDGYNYRLSYNDEDFDVQYSYENWRIIDSWKITNAKDMKKICELLIEEHPIHGSDMVSYRTADDMVYEWEQHNIGYMVLPEDNPWRDHAKDVDLDPADQGRSFREIYKDRTGEDLDLDIQQYLENYL